MWLKSVPKAAVAGYVLGGISATAATIYSSAASADIGFSGQLSAGYAVPNPGVGAGLPLLAAVISLAVWRYLASRKLSTRDID